MDGADAVVIAVVCHIAIVVHLDTQIHLDLILVGFLHGLDGGNVDLCPLFAHAVALIKEGMAVTGEADFWATQANRLQDQRLRGGVAVTEAGVGVIVGGGHFVIFSCLTL